MTDVVLFHHAQGLTAGVHAFADRLRSAGHRVTVPDLYAGATYETIEAGVAHAEEIGFGEITKRGVQAVEHLPEAIVYAGFSLGALPAQKLAQTRPGALGAILYAGGIPVSSYSEAWPASVPLQIHLSEQDEWSELDVAQDLTDAAPDGTLFVYPGSGHLISDSSLAEYEPETTELILKRTQDFLARLG